MNKTTIGLVIFILILIGIIIYVSVKKSKDEESGESQVNPGEWPEPSYMDKVGKFCPTGWVYRGVKDGKDVCLNRYNIPVNSSMCYTNANSKTRLFPKFNANWADCLSDTSKCRRQVCPRQMWIKKCGITPNKDAQWIGYDKLGTQCPTKYLP